jgi:hypothetical protein
MKNKFPERRGRKIDIANSNFGTIFQIHQRQKISHKGTKNTKKNFDPLNFFVALAPLWDILCLSAPHAPEFEHPLLHL